MQNMSREMKLFEYLKENDYTTQEFADMSNIPVRSLYFTLNGAPVKLLMAAKIIEITDGDVGLEDLLSEKQLFELEEWRESLE